MEKHTNGNRGKSPLFWEFAALCCFLSMRLRFYFLQRIRKLFQNRRIIIQCTFHLGELYEKNVDNRFVVYTVRAWVACAVTINS